MKRQLARLAAAMTALSISVAAPAAILQVNGSSQLTGATGVDVGGTLYDVSFNECDIGTGGFSAGCTPFFTTQDGARSAARALLDQVLLDGVAGDFDSHPERTFGCSDLLSCIIAVPYNYTADTVAAANFVTDSNDGTGYTPFYWNSTTHGTTPLGYAVFANFTPSAVPEPGSWAMMLFGFAAIGLSLQRRRPKLRPVMQRTRS